MPARSGPSRVILTIRSLLVMGGLGASLAAYNVFNSRRDVALALGPTSSRQEQFFIDAADQPDIKVFYRKLTDTQKVQVASNIGRYSDAPLAKLCAILLGDFSNEARTLLTSSLTKVARAHPDAVAAQLSQTGSFEAFGVRQALTNVGQEAVPEVVKTLSTDGTRQNAEDLLVSEGVRTISVVLPLLDSPDQKIQVAAVQILGKLRADEALTKITEMEQAAVGSAKAPYLGAIASIGDPKSESLLSDALSNSNLNSNVRTQAAFGLGRIASASSVRVLWKYAQDLDSSISQGCLSGLTQCKDKALANDGESESLRLQVAGTINSAAADELIRNDLAKPDVQREAILAASGRAELAPSLVTFLTMPGNQVDGLVADDAIKSLMSTSQGRSALDQLSTKPLLAGLIKRREALAKTD